ncbi:MAG TPA: RtcB family protein [Candidatus Diapherotrites archaeon]|uniref:tRNA-splicing ligase RtcB n=1 Tax=Candidatus Iainarchaeum sp. TaxID=3101447 RepID=A0A7J4JTT4_9ARCH|nr:RtcB family protein [Candidatus Diapherotrites archaeon]
MPEFKKLSEAVWEIPASGNMKVPGKIFATEKLLREIEQGAIQQLKNVAELQGIEKASIGMPDMHWGYGFCIGGVAAFDLENGVISPGGIGFDVNCGVRVLLSNLQEKEIKPKLKELMDELFKQIPSGVGSKGKLKLSERELKEVLNEGAEWTVRKGYGWKEDLERIEDYGCIKQADVGKVSAKALQRGMPQIGTLGSGNHFLEVQKVEKVLEPKVAKAFGLKEGQIVIMIHSGSRGCGHQIASDYIEEMLKAMQKYSIQVPDRQLACAPINSKEGQNYIAAMSAAANYAFANRQAMMHWTRQAFEKVLGQDAESLGLQHLYDVAHNIGKIEEHKIDGKKKEVLVHRKGATRAFPAGRKENPKVYKETGHPAIVPGSMGTASYILVGTEKGLQESFGSVCHGAGRTMSRHSAMQKKSGQEVKAELEAKGEIVKALSLKGLAEEMPEAYKDVHEVVKSVELAGIGKTVARLKPLAVMKG